MARHDVRLGMPGQDASPIEWVVGSRYWWLRFASIPVVVGYLAWMIWWEIHARFEVLASPAADFLWGGFFVAIAAPPAIVYYIPPRRIGLSATGLTIDTGLRRVTYPWTRVRTIVRRRVHRSEWGLIVSTCETSVSVSDPRNLIRLSPTQGDRLAAFVRIP
jgi:hypothetical protein